MISLTFLEGAEGRTFVLVYVHLSYNYYEIGFCSKGLLIVYCTVYIMVFSFINEIFNFCINNVVRNPIINKDLFYILFNIALGPIFSNFNMSVIENMVFNTINKPNSYLRYAANILLLSNSTDEINKIQETFQNISVLNFTQEININNKILFLGTLIDSKNIDSFTTNQH